MVLRGLLVGTVLVGIGVAFAACSDDPPGLGGDGGSTPTSTTTTTTPRPSTTTTSTTPPFPTGTSTTPPPPDAAVPDSSVADSSSADAADGAVAPTFTQVYTIFMTGNRCTTGHGAGGRGGLSMNTKPIAHAALVGIDATTACGGVTKRVTASNAAQSKLFLKLSSPLAAVAACGGTARMPSGGGTLFNAAELKTVQDWINAGALNN